MRLGVCVNTGSLNVWSLLVNMWLVLVNTGSLNVWSLLVNMQLVLVNIRSPADQLVVTSAHYSSEKKLALFFALSVAPSVLKFGFLSHFFFSVVWSPLHIYDIQRNIPHLQVATLMLLSVTVNDHDGLECCSLLRQHRRPKCPFLYIYM